MASSLIKKPDIKVDYSSPTLINFTSGMEISRTSILLGFGTIYNGAAVTFYVNNAIVTTMLNNIQGYALQIPVCIILSKGDVLKIVRTEGVDGSIACALYPINFI